MQACFSRNGSVALLLSIFSTMLDAAPPKLDHLFPTGVTRGETTTIQVGGKFDAWPPQVWVDRKGVTVTADKERGEIKVSADPSAENGIYYLRFYDTHGASTVRPLVVDSLPSIAEAEPNNNIRECQMLIESSNVDGRFDKTGDADLYGIKMQKGQVLVASLEANNAIGSPMDSVMQIVGPKGFVIDQNNDSVGLDPRIAFTAPADGNFFVRLFCFPATPNSSIEFAGRATFIYRLTVTIGGFIDHVQPLALSENEPTDLRLVGWNIPEDLSVVAAAEVPESGNVYRAELASFAKVKRTEHPVITKAALSDKALVPVPFVLSSTIDAGNFDSLEINVAKDQSLTFTIEADSLGFLLDPVLKIYDSTDKLVKEVDDTDKQRDIRYTHGFKAEGNYRVEVHDLHRSGGLRYAYRMTIEPTALTYRLNVQQDAFELKAGEKKKLPVDIVRDRGFDKEIAISIEGLPKSISAAVVKSEAKGGTAKKVELELSAGAESFSGPIRVIGKVEGEANSNQHATFPVANTSNTLSAIWLTVTK